MQMISRIVRYLLPHTCLACHRRLQGEEQWLCFSCMLSLPRTQLVGGAHENDLARRFWGVFSIEGAATAFVYQAEGPLCYPIHLMKYRHKRSICRLFGRILTAEPLTGELIEQADVIVPVPVTPARRKERGYNQAEELAFGIREVTGKEVVCDALQRVRFTDSQTARTQEERMENVRGAFVLGDTDSLRGRHILLLDDIVTTGATLMECLSMLCRVPGVRISIVTLAWTN